RMNQCTSAIAAYRRYSTLEPDKSEPYYGLGLCLRETGDRPGAIEALKHYVAIEKQPGSKWVENARAILVELGANAAPAASVAPAATTPAANPPAAVNAKPGPKAGAATGSPFAEAQALRDHGQIDEAVIKYQQAIA